MENVFLCPICGQEAEVCIAGQIKYIARLDLPYFVCVSCCTVYYDKSLIRKIVSRWRNNDTFVKKVPYRIAYREAKEILDEIMKHRIEKMGCRFVRFKKKK